MGGWGYIGSIGYILGLYRDRKENGNCYNYFNGLYRGIMEKKMDTAITTRMGYIGIMEKKMQTTILCRGCIWGLYRDYRVYIGVI